MQQSIFNLPIFGNEEVVSNEPPTLISLIKKRRNLKKNKGVTVVDMDGAVISDQNVNAGLDNEIGTIDSQLTSLGINPDEADIKVGDLPDTISDQNIQDLLKEQNKYSFNQKKSALLWKQALRDKILAQPDSPEKQSQVESWSYLNDNIEFAPGFSGKSNLDYNNFYNGINGAKSLIVSNLQGDERNQALANLRKSTEDGFAKLLLKDPNAQQRWKDLGLNPFQGVALDVMKIDGDGDVYENQIKIKTTDPKAQAEQRYKLAELENLGMNIVGGSLNRILEDRSNKSKEANEFYNQNKERLNQLATIIKQDKNLSPSAKSTLAGFQDEYDNVMQGKDPSGKFFITMDLEGLESKIKSGDASRVDVITYNKRIDQLNTIASKYKSALNQYMDDSGASDETIAEYNKLVNDIEGKKPDQVGTDAAVAWVEYMNNLKQSQKDRFPEYTKFEIERLVKDVAGEKRGLVERNLWKSVTPFADIVRGSKDIVNEFFLSPEELEQSRMSGAFDRRILDMEVGYDTPEERAEDDRPFIPVFSKPVEDNIANIKSSDMSEDEKQSRIRFIVEQEAKNGKVKYIANPRFGKLNLTGTAMVARTLDFASQFAPQMTISYLSGGFGNVSKLRRLMTLAGSTAASSFAREYDGAVQRGESNPFQRAAVKTLSEAASETIFDDIKFLKKISSSKVLGDITDEQWNNIRKSFGSKVLDAAKVGGGAFLKEAAVEEPISQVMDNVSSNLIFNEDVGAFDNVEKVLLESMMGMAPLSALGMAGRYRKTNLGQKHIMYQIGYKADDVIQAVNDRLASGEITADEARQRIAAANTMKSVIANMPMYDKSGKPLDDDQKARYAWNEYSKTIASAPEALPTEQKNELKDIVEQADQENSKILNGEDVLIDKDATTESQVQEGRTESNISQPQGAVQGQPEVGQGEGQQGQAEIPPADVSDSDIGSKREVIKQKFDFITDQDFVAESFTPEEDAADRAALPESEFKSEQELEAFLADGEYAMLTGMNPDAVALSKIANKKLNDRATQWLADRGLKATPIFGKYDNSERSFLVPNMTKAQAIEFAKEFQQDSVAHSSGLVYKDGSFNPRTEGVNLEPRFDQGGDFFSSINIGGKPVDFSVNYDFETTVPAEGMQVDEQGQLIDTKLQDAVGKASQALEKSGIKFNIIDTSVNPEQADAARGNQAIFRDTDGTITIDKSKLANDIEAGIVVWHESSHPVMNIIRNTDRRLYDAVVRGLTDAAKKNTGIQKALDWATDGYEGNDVQADEALVETIARIAEGVVDVSTLDTGLRQRIIDFINDIAKIFGIDPILNNTDLAEFKRVATQVADALSQGRDIAEIVGEENVDRFENKVNQLSVGDRFDFLDEGKRLVHQNNPNNIYNVIKFADESSIPTNLEFKRELQNRFRNYIKEIKKVYGKDFEPLEYNDAVKAFYTDALREEARKAIADHPEAIGWYDQKTKNSLAIISLIHPEIATDRTARAAFILPLAITSNGNLVDKNFEYALDQYEYYKDNGRYKSEGEFGKQQAGIKSSLDLMNMILDSGITMDQLTDYFTSKQKAGELKFTIKVDGKPKSINLSGNELVNEEVYAASILGPKIGNGFYMNLWGEFEQLTMDRWFMRTWGRLGGTLVDVDKDLVKAGKERIKNALADIKKDPDAKAVLKSVVGSISDMSITDIAIAVKKMSIDKGKRAELAGNPLTNELRKAANNLVGITEGEVEAPRQGTERKFIREVFRDVQKSLKLDGIDITMADLQAVLWYPEKILYDSFQKGKTFEQISKLYEEGSAPDYQNAAAGIARKRGFTDEQINGAIRGGLPSGQLNERADGGISEADRQANKERIFQVVREVKSKEKPEVQASVGGRNIEDISSVRKVSKGVFDSIKDVVTKLGYGYLPDDVQKKMKKKQMLINEDLHDMEVMAAQLNEAIKKEYGKKYENLDEDTINLLDSALRNFNDVPETDRDAVRDSIPDSILSKIESMRTYIDVMSQRLVSIGVLDSDLEPAFDNDKGLGVYITRSYRKYDEDSRWNANVPEEVRQRAFEYLKANNKVRQFDDQGNEIEERDMTDEEIEGLINYIASNTDPVMDGLNAANAGKVKADILKGRKVIPKEIRDLMGEYKDPMVNFAKTIAKISSLYHTYNTLKAIGEENMGKIFFKRPTGEYYVPVAGEGTSKVQPLVGLYTTPEIADAFRKATDNATSNDANLLALRLLASVNGIVKIGKTAGSVSSWIRNIIGGYGLMVKDGHILGTGMADGWKTAFKYFTNKSTDNPEAQAKFKEYVRMGIIGDGVGVGEFFAIVKAAQKYENPIDWLTNDSKLGRFVKGVKGLYSVQDDIFRVWAYENEKARLEARKTDMSEQEVRDEAARKARATYPTYSETPEIVRQLAKFVPISSFPAFTAELIRTYKNSLKIAIEEIKDPDMRDVGIKRLSGTMMYTFMGYLLTSISASLMGVTDEEEEDIRRYLPEWSKNSQLLYIGRGDNGLPIYIDMGFSLPASYFAKPTVAMGREDRDFADKAKDALGEIASPFISPEILLAQIAKGYKKTRRSDDLDEILGKYAGPIYEALEPGTIASLRRIYKGVAGDVDSYGQRYDSKLETIAFTTGQRIKSMEIPVGFLFKVRDFMDYKSDVTGAYYTAKRNVRADKSQVRDKLEEANEKLKEQFEEFRKDYKSGLRLLSKGTTVKRAKNAMRQIMEDKNVPKDFIKALEQNKLMPPLKDKEDKK
jgi:hypothetical protein